MPKPFLSQGLVTPSVMSDAGPVYPQMWEQRDQDVNIPETFPITGDSFGPMEQDRIQEILRLLELLKGLPPTPMVG